MNNDLVKEVDSLVSLTETRRIPETIHVNDNNLIFEIRGSVGDDYKSAVNEVSHRVNDFTERLSHLCFGDSVEFVCCMKRLVDCEERLTVLFPLMRRVLMERFWGKGDVAKRGRTEREIRKFPATGGLLKTSESRISSKEKQST
ncbi:hypothetical protein RJ641_010007 [Dillenia turbinata]|uniref:Uncharacterized protein n=1 Tax=Dillenia turbinata TaxID=194707 RepID=A0AAN8Z3Y1_9MAGN